MKKLAMIIFLTGLAALAFSTAAHAQGGSAYAPYGRSNFNNYNPYGQPVLSPYLGLLRGGLPAANYFLGVLPQIDQRATNIQFGSALQDLEQRYNALPGEAADPLGLTTATGHPTAFGYTGSYFGSTAPRTGQAQPQGQPGRRGR